MTKSGKSTVFFITAGGLQNRTNVEVMAGLVEQVGIFEVVDDIEAAEHVVVNTCALTQERVDESMEYLLEMVSRKRAGKVDKIVLTGGLAQLRGREIVEDFPEIDAYLGSEMVVAVNEALLGSITAGAYAVASSFLVDHTLPRVRRGPSGAAYLRASVGALEDLTFSLKPKMWGDQMSRPIDDIIAEARDLSARGFKELTLVGHAMTDYGSDLRGSKTGRKAPLIQLLRALESEVPDIKWVRLTNLVPENFSDALVDLFRHSTQLVPYLDLRMLHIVPRILLSMHISIDADDEDKYYDKDAFLAKKQQNLVEKRIKLIEKLRDIDDLVIRADFVVGFPGETDEEFEALYQWVEATRFDRIRVFRFTAEDEHEAAKFGEPVPDDIIEERYERLVALQDEISLERNQEWIAQVTEVLVEGVSNEHEAVWQGRHFGQGPEGDGVVYLSFDYGGELPEAGDFVQVEINQATALDLAGIVLPDE